MRVVGVETEYGLIARTREDASRPWRRLLPDEAGAALFAPVAKAWRSTSAFLPNGGRLYLDVGAHPEYATPECTSAHDVVVAERAGDALLLDLAARARAEEAASGRDTVFSLIRNNVDPWGNTYGCHENYLVGRDLDPDALEGWLIPFLVARQLLVGAGRWRRGRFTVSQRCDALADLVSNQTTRSRPLVNTRDEPHADPDRWRRLHVISGDSNRAETSAWLKVAATDLVLRLAETGRTPPLALVDPLAALRRWGGDPDAGVAVQSGGLVSCRELLATWHAAAADVADDPETQAAWQAWDRTAAASERPEPSPDAPEWLHKRATIAAWQTRHGLALDDPALDDLDVRWHVLGGAGLATLLESHQRWPRRTTDAEVDAAASTAPSATRAWVRGALIAAARRQDRDFGVDWSSFVVRDLAAVPASGAGGLGGGLRPRDVTLRWDDPLTTHDPASEALLLRMEQEPRVRTLGGFVPPSG